MNLDAGTLIDDRYEVLDCVGVGSTGTVYKVADVVENRTLALKLLTASGANIQTRFMREFRLLADLDCDHVVRTLGWGTYLDAHYFTMEFLEGSTLRDAFEDRSFHQELRSSLWDAFVEQVSNALIYVHEQGLVHRDLKPSNLMLCGSTPDDLRVVLLDLGLAKFRGQGDRSLTQSGSTLGTAAYMSPEQGKGSWVDHRSDLYSFGVILYELLAGVAPFQGDDPVSVIFKHIRELPTPLRNVDDTIPVETQHLVLKLLEKEPADRFQTAAEFLLAFGSSEVSERLPDTSHPLIYQQPPMVGREEELKQARQCLRDAFSGEKRVLIVSGEAGIGKSRFFEELCGDGVVHGFRILRASCYEGGVSAYGPLVEALPDSWLPSERDHQAHTNNRFEVMEQIATHLEDMALQNPVLLGIEDVHWADELTLQFLRYLCSDPKSFPLVVCLTVRSQDPATLDFSPSGAVTEPLRLHLKALDRDVTRLLAGAIFGGPDVPDGILSSLSEATGGNPLFIVETIRTMLADKRLRLEDGTWRTEMLPDSLFPATIKDVLLARAKTLNPETRRVLECASTINGSFTFDTIAALWRGDDLTLLDILERLADGGTLSRIDDADDVYRFSSAFFRQVVYEGMSVRKRQLLHLSTANALEAEGGPIDRIASHFSRSTEIERAFPFLVAAAREAIHTGAYRTAVEHIDAIDAGALTDEAECLRAQAYVVIGENDKAGNATQALLDNRERLPSDLLALVLKIHGSVCSYQRRGEEAEACLLDCLGMLDDFDDKAEVVDVLAKLSNLYDLMGRRQEASQVDLRAAEIASKIEDPLHQLKTHMFRAHACLVDFRYDDARPHLEKALLMEPAPGFRSNRLDCVHFLSRVCFYAGEFHRCESLLNEFLIECQKLGRDLDVGRALMWLGELALEQKEFQRSVDFFETAVGALSEISEEYFIYRAWAGLTVANIGLGDSEAVRKCRERTRNGVNVKAKILTGNLPRLWSSIGVANHYLGDIQGARKAFQQALHSGQEPKGGEWAVVLMQAVEFFDGIGSPIEAEKLAVDARETLVKMKSENLLNRLDALLNDIRRKQESGHDLTSQMPATRLSALIHACRDLTTDLELDALLDRILAQVVETLEVERAIVALTPAADDSGEVEVARSSGEEPWDGEEVSLGVIQRVIRTGEPVISYNAREDASLSEFKSIADYGIRALACVPLEHPRDGRVGVLYVDHRAFQKEFAEEEVAFLEAFASLVTTFISNARAHESLRARALHLQSQVEDRHGLGDLVGGSPAIREVYALIDHACRTDLTVLLQGETGTGKELAARAIHFGSGRKSRPFLTQNCAALSDELLQSDLFGHRKGSFTGAVSDRKGLFESADGGTLFLDEIGDASPAVQSSLLRAVQEGEIRRVGEDRSRRVDVRVVAASNRDLKAAVEEGIFREDLYCRLSVLQIQMPPIRSRVEDIPLLADHFIRLASARMNKDIEGLTVGAIDVLARYRWPGNVRQLENEISRAVSLARSGDAITPDLFSVEVRGEAELDSADTGSLRERVQGYEISLILRALEEFGNITQAARRLGLTRNGLQKKISRLGIRPKS